MSDLSTPAFSLAFLGLCVGLAWASGAVFGWGLRETVAFLVGLRAGREPKTRAPILSPDAAESRPKSRRRRHGGYYFSEETRSWGSRRWRRRLGWISAGMVVIVIGFSLALAFASYKPHHAPSAASGGRHHLNGRL